MGDFKLNLLFATVVILLVVVTANQSVIKDKLIEAEQARKNISQCTMVNENDVWYLSKGTGVCP